MAIETDPLNPTKKTMQGVTLDKTFCIEWLRLIAFIALAALFGAANIFAKKFVFINEDGADQEGFVLFGVEHPYIHMKDTVIFKTFGLPHTCSYIDFNPAKEVGAILLPFFSFPMTMFLILAHYRNELVYTNDPDNSEARNLAWYSRLTTGFSVAVIQLTHLWFVNDPEEVYPKAVGFVGHYIPYALFQTSLAVVAVMQVMYDQVGGTIPYGFSAESAKKYVWCIILLTILYQAIVIGVLIDKPIIDARNGGWEATFFQVMVKLYALVSLGVPVACSIWTIRYSGDTNSFKMAIQ